MKRDRYLQVLLVPLLLGLLSGNARADGGVVRLREARGPYVVTVFTASEPLRDNPVDVSVLVQRRDSADAILDATVDLIFTPPPESAVEPAEPTCGQSQGALMSHPADGQMTPFSVPATHKQASNKLLYAAPIRLGTTGNWQLQAAIERGNDVVKVSCIIPVGSPPRRLTGLVPYLVLPPLMVSLFAINQCLRPRSSAKKRSQLSQSSQVSQFAPDHDARLP